MDLYLFTLATLLVCFVVSIFSRGFWTELLRSNAQPTLPPLSQCCSLLVTADSCFLSFHLCTAWEHTHTLFPKCLIYCIHCTYSNMLDGCFWWWVYIVLSTDPFSCRHTHTHYPYTLTVQCLKVMPTTVCCHCCYFCNLLIHHSSHFPFLLKFNLSSYNTTLYSLMCLWIVLWDIISTLCYFLWKGLE